MEIRPPFKTKKRSADDANLGSSQPSKPRTRAPHRDITTNSSSVNANRPVSLPLHRLHNESAVDKENRQNLVKHDRASRHNARTRARGDIPSQSTPPIPGPLATPVLPQPAPVILPQLSS
ncbi:hypothetical protein K3495_g9842 [Podosphaera aphanis]|nr:hypothetical protein K3495_g9842 [Podosphaera aphanis]